MTHWVNQLRDEQAQRESRHLLRRLRAVDRCALTVEVGGRTLINFASNDYLALAKDPRLADAAIDATRRYGVGAGASRLVSGDLNIHRQLERRFAAFKHAEAALLTPTGYMANLAVLGALAGADDLIALDKLCHASLIDAARASRAEVRIYPHGNLSKLARLLERGASKRRRFIVTDAVFSMDGDCADLPALCALRDRHEAILVVDEAHATGVLGRNGAGLAEAQDVAGQIDVTISTAGKALGCLGGVITSSRIVIDTLINHARSFIYTTAVPPAQAAAIGAALDIVHQEPQRRAHLGQFGRQIRAGLREAGWAISGDPTPIIPLILGSPAATLAMAQRLEDAGFFVSAIRPPTVAPDSSRLRISLRADHEPDHINRLVRTIGGPPS